MELEKKDVPTIRAVNAIKKSIIRERFEAQKDSYIESVVGKQDSWAKKVGTGQSGVMLDDIPKLLKALNLKVVDRSLFCTDKEEHEAYRLLAGLHLKTEPKLKQDWDEE